MRDDHHNIEPSQTQLHTLGPAKIANPIFKSSAQAKLGRQRFVDESVRMRVDPYLRPHDPTCTEEPSFERAGPREKIYFDPTKLKAAIVTCGGMCPGINSLVRAIVLQLHYIYGVRNVVGVRYGLQGFIPAYGHDLMDLNPTTVQNVHGRGGSFLGMSRGGQSIEEIVDSLERQNIGLLFMIGGDGTLRAAQSITEEITARGVKTGVVAIPKTIDNDISFVQVTFGFQTAVEAATRAILGAHNEATGAPGGVGLLKLMGRYSGFVAAHATLALTEVNFCLIPEVDWDLEGPQGLLSRLEERPQARGPAVIVVAEGAGQKLFEGLDLGKDASGNLKLGDIGTHLKDRIGAYFHERAQEINLKYIDPSYLIRSVPATPNDPPPGPETAGEWRRYGNHPSNFSNEEIEALLDDDAPNAGVLVVEVYYAYHQILKL
ncbi:MAG: ATP-dependent 6-phosphofructokinase, partial [Desulfarculus sp.]|nr:ATP-dependent 6-phosphofructokinase [Desulfarculus sp.]